MESTSSLVEMPPLPGQVMPPGFGMEMPPLPGQVMPPGFGMESTSSLVEMPPLPGQVMPPGFGMEMPPLPDQGSASSLVEMPLLPDQMIPTGFGASQDLGFSMMPPSFADFGHPPPLPAATQYEPAASAASQPQAATLDLGFGCAPLLVQCDPSDAASAMPPLPSSIPSSSTAMAQYGKGPPMPPLPSSSTALTEIDFNQIGTKQGTKKKGTKKKSTGNTGKGWDKAGRLKNIMSKVGPVVVRWRVSPKMRSALAALDAHGARKATDASSSPSFRDLISSRLANNGGTLRHPGNQDPYRLFASTKDGKGKAHNSENAATEVASLIDAVLNRFSDGKDVGTYESQLAEALKLPDDDASISAIYRLAEKMTRTAYNATQGGPALSSNLNQLAEEYVPKITSFGGSIFRNRGMIPQLELPSDEEKAEEVRRLFAEFKAKALKLRDAKKMTPHHEETWTDDSEKAALNSLYSRTDAGLRETRNISTRRARKSVSQPPPPRNPQELEKEAKNALRRAKQRKDAKVLEIRKEEEEEAKVAANSE